MSEPETRPPVLVPAWTYGRTHSWHWLVCERASQPSIAEWLAGAWYPGNHEGPISPAEMYRRGWRWHSQVEVPRVLREKDPTRGDLVEMFPELLGRG
jgi:hypothetical protein